jgi:diacylglycerol kinase
MIRSHLHSQRHAWRGLFFELSHTANLRIQLFAVLLVSTAGLSLSISATEWLVLLILFAGTISAELVNSSIEHLSDFVTMDVHEKIKLVKDIAAAGVLVWAVADVIAGIIIFGPYLVLLYQNL